MAARGVLYNAVTVCTVLNVLVGLTEDIPWTVTLTALAAHATYRHTLRAFPVLEIDGTFILGCVLLLAHNVLAFDVFVSTWYPFDEVSFVLFRPLFAAHGTANVQPCSVLMLRASNPLQAIMH